ncbi:putative membrane protein [Acinetobacter baumannii 25977_9]|nr:putative membrane protein [Acinetobacter sp. 25977_10]KCZ33218.1 putative membrane protein [Acinetobacter baumannii 25977_9]
MTYVVMGFEVFVATLILPFEYQTGASSSPIGFIHISAYFAVILGIARLVVWAWVKFVT